MRYLLTLLLLLGALPAQALMIEDGKGTGTRAEVNIENQLVVSAITSTELEHESESNGQAYSWTTDSIDIDAGDTVLLIKNTSDTNLHIDTITMSGKGVASWVVHLPTSEVTLAGNTITGVNLNTSSSNVADAGARSDETNNVQGNILYSIHILSSDVVTVNLDGLILGKNKSIGVDQTENLERASATFRGHYQD